MSLILNIDSTSETALVNIAENGLVLFEEINEHQKDHASFLHPAMQSVLDKAGKSLHALDAVAVSHGPGSYTGIRVGVAAAKGLCYAAGKPLITINQLEILAKDAIDNHTAASLYVPMIDARRMEVFTAVYDKELNCLREPSAVILEGNSFENYLLSHSVVFCGNGAVKWQTVCNSPLASFAKTFNKGFAFALLSHKSYIQKHFADLVYSTPLYIKDFHTVTPAR